VPGGAFTPGAAVRVEHGAVAFALVPRHLDAEGVLTAAGR
jgi:hypothetical protein